MVKESQCPTPTDAAHEGETSEVFHAGLLWVQTSHTLKKCWTMISQKQSHTLEETLDTYERGFNFLLLPLVSTVLAWVWLFERLSHQWGSVSERAENKPDPWRWCNIPGILETTPWIPKLFLVTWPNPRQCFCLPISAKMPSVRWNRAATIGMPTHQNASLLTKYTPHCKGKLAF